jgi:hypothetical protein
LSTWSCLTSFHKLALLFSIVVSVTTRPV